MIDELDGKRLDFYKPMLLGTIQPGKKGLVFKFQIDYLLFLNFSFSCLLFDVSSFSGLASQDMERGCKICMVQAMEGKLLAVVGSLAVLLYFVVGFNAD